MRVSFALLVLILCLTFQSCHTGNTKKNAAQKREKSKIEEKKKEPVDLGDPTAPLEIRALRGAKEVKKEMDKRRQEENEALQQRDQ